MTDDKIINKCTSINCVTVLPHWLGYPMLVLIIMAGIGFIIEMISK